MLLVGVSARVPVSVPFSPGVLDRRNIPDPSLCIRASSAAFGSIEEPLHFPLPFDRPGTYLALGWLLGPPAAFD